MEAAPTFLPVFESSEKRGETVRVEVCLVSREGRLRVPRGHALGMCVWTMVSGAKLCGAGGVPFLSHRVRNCVAARKLGGRAAAVGLVVGWAHAMRACFEEVSSD